MCDVKSSEDRSSLESEITTENSQSCNADDKVDENRTVAPSNLMGPPVTLPPSLSFKKPLPVKMSLRITDTSADFISSGERKRDKKARNNENLEEGNTVLWSQIVYFYWQLIVLCLFVFLTLACLTLTCLHLLGKTGWMLFKIMDSSVRLVFEYYT